MLTRLNFVCMNQLGEDAEEKAGFFKFMFNAVRIIKRQEEMF